MPPPLSGFSLSASCRPQTIKSEPPPPRPVRLRRGVEPSQVGPHGLRVVRLLRRQGAKEAAPGRFGRIAEAKVGVLRKI